MSFTTRVSPAVRLVADASGARDRGARAGRRPARRVAPFAGAACAWHRVALARRTRDARRPRLVPRSGGRRGGARRGSGASVRAPPRVRGAPGRRAARGGHSARAHVRRLVGAARAPPDGMPLAASEHNALQWPGRVPARALREALARVDLCFAHGPAARREILAAGLAPERMREGSSPIAGTGVPPLRRLPSPRIVFAGRLHPEKGPDLLLDALARLAEPPSAFLLGAGVMEPELRRHAARLGIEQCVHFEGWRDHPESWIKG